MQIVNLSEVSSADTVAAEAIAKEAHVNLDDCYQCGKCTAGCQMAHAMDLVPRQVIRMLQLGLTDKVINAKGPWVCLNCMVCSARCPQGVDIAGIMMATRHAAKRMKLRPEPNDDKFDDAFVSNIRSFGKSNEAILAAKYNLASGHLFQDVNNVPKMLSMGMIGPKIHSVKDKQAVRDLVDRVLNKGRS
ncbi:MAG: 4Fe-4S dicluster domain-containing protein [Coriobacteriales bacterium]|nr:4Fe-4S dicluster domain-containing protein [Coriobacteriales bacterium]